MAFGNISTFYLPIAANAGSSLWGTDVRKVLSTQESTDNGTTITNQGTGITAVVRTLDPYTTTAGDLDQSLYGWAIQPSDMGSVAGAKRFFLAGDHTLTIRASQDASTALTLNITVYAYRVGPAPGRTRTLLGSQTTTDTVPGLQGEDTIVAPLALPEIVFEADETIQYAYEVSAPGVAVTGRQITWYTGLRVAVHARMDTPGLKTLGETTGSAAGGCTVTGTMGATSSITGNAAGTCTVSGSGGARIGTTGTSAGLGTASGTTTAIGSMTGSATGVATANGTTAAISGTVGSSAGLGTVNGVTGKILSITGSAAGLGTATGVGASGAGTTGSSTGTSTVSGLTSSIAGTTGTVTGLGTASGVTTAIGSMLGSAVGSSGVSGSMGATGAMTGSVSGSSQASGELTATGGMVGSAGGTSTVTAEAASLSGTVGSATGTCTVQGVAGSVFGTIGSVVIGEPGSGEPAVTRIVYIPMED